MAQISIPIPDMTDDLKDMIRKSLELAMDELTKEIHRKDFMSQQEAITYLGISYSTFKKLVEMGLPSFRVDRKIIYSRREINDFIKKNSTSGVE